MNYDANTAEKVRLAHMIDLDQSMLVYVINQIVSLLVIFFFIVHYFLWDLTKTHICTMCVSRVRSDLVLT